MRSTLSTKYTSASDALDKTLISSRAFKKLVSIVSSSLRSVSSSSSVTGVEVSGARTSISTCSETSCFFATGNSSISISSTSAKPFSLISSKSVPSKSFVTRLESELDVDDGYWSSLSMGGDLAGYASASDGYASASDGYTSWSTSREIGVDVPPDNSFKRAIVFASSSSPTMTS